MEFLGLQCPDDDPPCKLSGLVALTAAVIDLLDLAQATVDGFSDCGELPRDAEAALADLHAVALVEHERQMQASRWYRWIRRSGPTNMAVAFDLRASGRHVVEQFGPYSISTEIADAAGRVVLDLHDSGTSISIETFSQDQDAAVTKLLRELNVVFTPRP